MEYKRSPKKTKFYNSAAWRKSSKAYAQSVGWICEICHNKYADPNITPYFKQFHVHHKIELTEDNIDNPDIALNWDNFQLLCLHCHNIVTSQKPVLAAGLEFDEKGMIRKCQEAEKQSRRT